MTLPAEASRPCAGRWWPWWLLLLAIALRVGWVLVRYAPAGQAEHLEYGDEVAYVQVAESLAAGQGLVDELGYRATYMPAYPAFLALFQALPRPLLAARIGQAVLAALVAPAAYWLGRRFACGDPSRQWIGVLSGLAAACDPFLIFFSGLLLTEALFAVVLTAGWVFVIRLARVRGSDHGRLVAESVDAPHPLRVANPVQNHERSRLPGGDVETSGWRPVWLGAAAGAFLLVGILLRPSAVVLLMLTPLGMVVVRRLDVAAWKAALTMTAVVVLGLSPWAARNRAVIGEWRWLTTRGGISLYDGLRFGATGESDLAHTKQVAAVAGLDEVGWDRYWRDQALLAARQEPGRVFRLAAVKFVRTWSLRPNVESHRRGRAAMISAAWMSFALACAAVGWWRSRRFVARWVMLLLPVVAFTLLHMIYVGSVRYRIPVMPEVYVLSAVGLASLVRALASLKAEPVVQE